MAIGRAQPAHWRISRPVAVLEPTRCFTWGAVSRVDTDHRLATNRATERDEFIRAKKVRLDTSPGKVRLCRSALEGAYPVLPMITANKISARPAQTGHVRLLQQPDDIRIGASDVIGRTQQYAMHNELPGRIRRDNQFVRFVSRAGGIHLQHACEFVPFGRETCDR